MQQQTNGYIDSKNHYKRNNFRATKRQGERERVNVKAKERVKTLVDKNVLERQIFPLQYPGHFRSKLQRALKDIYRGDRHLGQCIRRTVCCGHLHALCMQQQKQ